MKQKDESELGATNSFEDLPGQTFSERHAAKQRAWYKRNRAKWNEYNRKRRMRQQ